MLGNKGLPPAGPEHTAQEALGAYQGYTRVLYVTWLRLKGTLPCRSASSSHRRELNPERVVHGTEYQGPIL